MTVTYFYLASAECETVPIRVRDSNSTAEYRLRNLMTNFPNCYKSKFPLPADHVNTRNSSLDVEVNLDANCLVANMKSVVTGNTSLFRTPIIYVFVIVGWRHKAPTLSIQFLHCMWKPSLSVPLVNGSIVSFWTEMSYNKSHSLLRKVWYCLWGHLNWKHGRYQITRTGSKTEAKTLTGY